jgi:hypothetical protein
MDDRDGRNQTLAYSDTKSRWRLLWSRRRVDPAYDIEPVHDPSERGKALTIRASLAAMIQKRLIADANEKIATDCVGTRSCGRHISSHGHGSVEVLKTGLARPLKGHGGERVASALLVDASLNDLDRHVFSRLVVRPNGAVELAAVVQPCIDVPEEVGGGGRRTCDIELNSDAPQLRLEHDNNWRRHAGRRRSCYGLLHREEHHQDERPHHVPAFREEDGSISTSD